MLYAYTVHQDSFWILLLNELLQLMQILNTYFLFSFWLISFFQHFHYVQELILPRNIIELHLETVSQHLFRFQLRFVQPFVWQYQEWNPIVQYLLDERLTLWLPLDLTSQFVQLENQYELKWFLTSGVDAD